MINSFNPGDAALRIDKGFGSTGPVIPVAFLLALPVALPNPFTGGFFTVGVPLNARVYA